MQITSRPGRGWKSTGVLLCSFLWMGGMALAGESSYMVFDASHTNETEWTFHDVKFYSGKENNAYLYSASGYIESPLFTHPVVRVTVSFRGATAETRRILVVAPVDAAGGGISGAAQEFGPQAAVAEAVASWDAEAEVCRFRIGSGTGGGNMHLYNCLVELADGMTLAFAPAGLENRRVWGNSFVAGWSESAGAEAYLVDLYRVDSCASSWSGELMSEGFDSAVNAKGSVLAIADIPAAFPMLDGAKLYIPAHTNGLIQIGTGDKAGCVALAGCPVEEGCAIRFRAKRYTHDGEGSVMPLLWTNGSETNDFASVQLTDDMAEYEVPFAGAPAGSVAILHSTTNRSTAASARGRVWLDSVSVVSGYTPGCVATNAVAESVRTSTPSCKFSGLRRGATYLWRVRSVCGETSSAPSPLQVVVPEGEMERTGTTVIVR